MHLNPPIWYFFVVNEWSFHLFPAGDSSRRVKSEGLRSSHSSGSFSQGNCDPVIVVFRSLLRLIFHKSLIFSIQVVHNTFDVPFLLKIRDVSCAETIDFFSRCVCVCVYMCMCMGGWVGVDVGVSVCLCVLCMWGRDG